eukprot:Hpha_TRINITY_DN12653_c0_g1::TRINITY_DN12653_c0_g1_i1::g.49440::m.49440
MTHRGLTGFVLGTELCGRGGGAPLWRRYTVRLPCVVRTAAGAGAPTFTVTGSNAGASQLVVGLEAAAAVRTFIGIAGVGSTLPPLPIQAGLSSPPSVDGATRALTPPLFVILCRQ